MIHMFPEQTMEMKHTEREDSSESETSLPIYKIDNLTDYLRLSSIEKIHLKVKTRLQGRLKFKGQNIWFPINDQETLQGWLEHHSPREGYYFENNLYTRSDFREIYRSLQRSEEESMSDYNVEFDIDYEKIVREIKEKSY